MFIFLFSVWSAALAWFGPRLIASMAAASGPISTLAQGYFIARPAFPLPSVVRSALDAPE